MTAVREARVLWWVAALALVAVVFPSRAAVPSILVVVLAGAASRWSVRRVARGLRVRCDVPRWVSHGQAVAAVVDLRNTSRIPAPWVELDLPCGMGLGRTAPHREVLALPPGAVARRRVPLVGATRGRHHVGPVRLRVGDVLGAADVAVTPVKGAEVVVFPRIVPLRRLGLPAASPFVTVPARHSLLADRTSVVGTRDYRQGDPLSAVHWPATARTGRLAVKTFQRAEARDTIVCLDLSADGYPRAALRPAAELAITVAASVAQHAVVEQRLPVGLVTSAPSPGAADPVLTLQPATGDAHLRGMLEQLALVQPGSGPTLEALLAGLGPGMSTGTTVLVVSGTLRPDVSEHLLRLARRGVATAVALTGPAAHHASDAALPGVPVYRVADLPDLPALAT